MPSQAQSQRSHPPLTIQLPTDKELQEDRRQQALERLRSTNRALPSEEPLRMCPSVPRPTTRQGSWDLLGAQSPPKKLKPSAT